MALVADPGFPVGGGGAPTSDVSTFQQTCVKTKELDPVRGRPPGSANDSSL